MATMAVLDRLPLRRAGLVSLLNKMGFGRIEEAADISELKRSGYGQGGFDILLFSLSHRYNDITSSASEDVVNSMVEIRSWASATRVVFLSKELDLSLLFSCFSAGASGFLLENISRDAFEDSLRLVYAGEKVFPSKLAALIADLVIKPGDSTVSMCRDFHLSDRDIDILRCLADGQPNKVIAYNLNITETTVKVHFKRIFRKIHVANRTQAALWAVESGLTATSSRLPGTL